MVYTFASESLHLGPALPAPHTVHDTLFTDRFSSNIFRCLEVPPFQCQLLYSSLKSENHISVQPLTFLHYFCFNSDACLWMNSSHVRAITISGFNFYNHISLGGKTKDKTNLKQSQIQPQSFPRGLQLSFQRLHDVTARCRLMTLVIKYLTDS